MGIIADGLRYLYPLDYPPNRWASRNITTQVKRIIFIWSGAAEYRPGTEARHQRPTGSSTNSNATATASSTTGRRSKDCSPGLMLDIPRKRRDALALDIQGQHPDGLRV